MEHESVNQDEFALTASLKVTVILLSNATADAPFAGLVLATFGAASGGKELRGFGVPAVKSELLLSVSVLPLPARSAAVVLLRPGATPAPSKQLAVLP